MQGKGWLIILQWLIVTWTEMLGLLQTVWDVNFFCRWEISVIECHIHIGWMGIREVKRYELYVTVI